MSEINRSGTYFCHCVQRQRLVPSSDREIYLHCRCLRVGEISMNQLCFLTAKAASCILGCISKSSASGPWRWLLPYFEQEVGLDHLLKYLPHEPVLYNAFAKLHLSTTSFPLTLMNKFSRGYQDVWGVGPWWWNMYWMAQRGWKNGFILTWER